MEVGLREQGVDDDAGILDEEPAQQAHEPRLGVDLHDAGGHAVGPGGVGAEAALLLGLVVDVADAPVARGLQTRLHALGRGSEGMAVDGVHGRGVGDAPIRLAGHARSSPRRARATRVRHPGGHRHDGQLGAQLERRLAHRGAADHDAAAAVVAQAVGARLGVALHDAHGLEGHAQGIGADLREAGLAARAGRRHPGQHADPAARIDAHGRAVIGRVHQRPRDGHALRRELLAQAQPQPAAFPKPPPARRGRPARRWPRGAGRGRPGSPGIDDRPARPFVREGVGRDEVAPPHGLARQTGLARHTFDDAVHRERGDVLPEATIRSPRARVRDDRRAHPEVWMS